MKNIAVNENHLYKKTYASGKKAYGKYTVVYVLRDLKASKFKKANPRKQYINRIGLTVTKKIGGAVVRNRVKRIIRAAFAETEKELCLKKGFLIVIAAREAAAGAVSPLIHEEMLCQFRKLDMVSVPPGTSGAPGASGTSGASGKSGTVGSAADAAKCVVCKKVKK